ncbi:MAG: hypothetical protein ACO1PW_02305 [Actinomycetota bacterium]
MSQTLVGASVFEQELYDHLSSHVDDEVEALRAYQALAESTESKAFAYLAGMILEDERRHHRMLADLAETVRVSAELRGDPTPIPFLDLHKDREAILAATEELFAVEKADEKELKALAKQLKDFKDTTLWELMLEIMRADNLKHRLILKFVREHAKRPL